MKYKNGRVIKINDRVVAAGTSGKFIGTVVSIEGEHVKVAPLHCQQAFYLEPVAVLHLDDALKPESEVAAA